MQGFKFVETLKITFEKQQGNKMFENEAYFNSTAQTIINADNITEALQFTEQQILNKMQQWISAGSAWLIQSVGSHFFNIVKYQPINGSSYIVLPPELRNASKGIINLKNEDNQRFRCCCIHKIGIHGGSRNLTDNLFKTWIMKGLSSSFNQTIQQNRKTKQY